MTGGQGAVRLATPADLDWVKAMADRHRDTLGFVRRGALAAALARRELLVVSARGFCDYHRRRDGQHVVYALCSEGHVGRALLTAVPLPRRLRCPVDLAANAFYAHMGGQVACVAPGKRVALCVWQWT